MTLVDLMDKGGFIAWVLVGYSLVALTVVIERLIHFYRLEPLPAGFETPLIAALKGGTAAELLRAQRGPEAELLKAMVSASAEGVRDLSRVATRVGSREVQRMERGLSTLGVLGNTAPLAGLLGTVAGVIEAFQAIQQAGGGVQVDQLAGGIWEAMVTTGMGISVALPVLLLLHALETLADRRARCMRSYASLALEYLPHSEAQDEGEVVHHPEGVIHAV